MVLSLDGSSRQILAQDREQDGGGGGSSTVVTVGKGSGSQGVVPLQTVAPSFRGALVVCPGGNDPQIRLRLIEAVSAPVSYTHLDDGPSARTREILEILEEYGVKATFFVVGKEDERSKQWMRDIVAAGHTPVSYTHLDVYKRQAGAGGRSRFRSPQLSCLWGRCRAFWMSTPQDIPGCGSTISTGTMWQSSWRWSGRTQSRFCCPPWGRGSCFPR